MNTVVDTSALKAGDSFMCPDKSDGRSGIVVWSYASILCAYTSMVLFWSLIASKVDNEIYTMYGFGQFRSLGWPITGLLLVMIGIWVFGYDRVSRPLHRLYMVIQKWVYSHPVIPMVISLVAAGIFFILCNNFLNSDGSAYTDKFLRIIPEKGALVTHDEILELFIHSKFWVITNHFFGWTVIFSFRVLSAISGGVFTYILLMFSRRLVPDHALGMALITATGGFMQLFFGDVENYTMTGVLILAYFYLSHGYIQRQFSLVRPAVCLAVAMMFHLLAGFLLPTLVYLFFLEFRRNGLRSVIIPLGGFFGVIVTVFTTMHFTYLPIRELYYGSHAMGHGGHFAQMLVSPSSFYYMELFSLFFLLMPASVLMLPLLLTRRVSWDPVNTHLFIGSVVMVAYMCVWEAKLGLYNDWNLFANVAIPLMLFTGYNLLKQENRGRLFRYILPTLLVMGIHSMIWIIGNHFQ